ncbi:MAG: hypothetical protein E7255_04260 [Lachnospiraceae bacterium]|nr:hypothetical protein [Lachnospiraceae bacterium]
MEAADCGCPLIRMETGTGKETFVKDGASEHEAIGINYGMDRIGFREGVQMEYIVKHCPKCNGELHIPKEMEQVICMFCGASFKGKEDTAAESEAGLQVAEENYDSALKNLRLLTKDLEKYMESFTKQSYDSSFERYALSGQEILKPIQEFASLSEEKREKAVTETAQTFVEIVIEEVEGKLPRSRYRQKRMLQRKVEQYRFFLAVYTVPMICYLGYSISEPLADRIIELWYKRYPKYKFHKGSFEDLVSGFKKKNPFFNI